MSDSHYRDGEMVANLTVGEVSLGVSAVVWGARWAETTPYLECELYIVGGGVIDAEVLYVESIEPEAVASAVLAWAGAWEERVLAFHAHNARVQATLDVLAAGSPPAWLQLLPERAEDEEFDPHVLDNIHFFE